MPESFGDLGMKGDLGVKVKRGGPWYRRLFYALCVDWWQGGRQQ